MSFAPKAPRRPGGGHGYLPHRHRAACEYLAAALPLGLAVRGCRELRFPTLDPDDAPPAQRVLPDHPSDIWTLQSWCPAATRAAHNGKPLLIFWHFQLTG
jgi:hypothetical protein